MSQEMKSMAIEPGSIGDVADGGNSALTQKRTSLWVTTPSETILEETTWALEGIMRKMARMARSMLRLAFIRPTPRAGRNVVFDPRRAPNERALIMAMTEADGDGGMLRLF